MRSLNGPHVSLHQLLLPIRVLLLQQQLECPSDWLVIRLVAVHIPILKDHYLIGILCVEEHAVAPGWRPLSIIYPLAFDVLVSGQEVDIALTVKRQHSRPVIQEILILLKQGGEVGLHIRLGQLLLGIVLLNRVE